MRLLVLVTNEREAKLIPGLLRQAGFRDYRIYMVNRRGFVVKPSMKLLRQVKPVLDDYIRQEGPFDYLIALGETAARLAFDTSAVNINKLRGRDFEYAYGTRQPSKRDTGTNKDVETATRNAKGD